MKDDVIIVIPAYNPDEKLIEIISELKYNRIIVVNDGSDEEKYFNQIKPYCEIITNIKNEGKGSALKKAYSYILEHYPNVMGVVTADADGQHQCADIIKIKKILQENDKIVLGVRDFNKKGIPLRNKIGNLFMNFIFSAKMKINIMDTQTGLRAIPTRYLAPSIKIDGEKYEYEIKQLILFAQEDIIQIPIDTIYLKNSKSFFKPIGDSIKILKAFL